MDPSYNNLGGNNPGGTNLGGNVAPAGGMPVGGTMPGGTVPGGSMPGGMASGNSMPGGVPVGGGMVSDGDVILGGVAPEKSSKTKIIILIVLVVLLALVGVGFLLWQNNAANNSETKQEASLQERYNSYVNYVLWGVESDGKPDLAEMKKAKPYLETIMNGEDSSQTGQNENTKNDKLMFEEYIAKEGALFADFSEAYAGYEGGEKVDVAVIESYFDRYPRLEQIDVSEMIMLYNEGGENRVKESIEEWFVQEGDDEKYLSEYLEKKNILAEQILNLIVKANAAGCIKDDSLDLTCYKMEESEDESLGDAMLGAFEASKQMRLAARDTLESIHGQLYENEEEGEVNEE